MIVYFEMRKNIKLFSFYQQDENVNQLPVENNQNNQDQNNQGDGQNNGQDQYNKVG
jgi:hypothetical protein